MLTGESISLTAKNLKFWEEVSMSTRRNKTEWLGLINQCRKSGLSDKAWCLKNEISYDAFRSAVRALRSSGYEIPDNEFNSKPVLDLTAKGQPVKIDIVDDVSEATPVLRKQQDLEPMIVEAEEAEYLDIKAPEKRKIKGSGLDVYVNGVYLHATNDTDPLLLATLVKSLKEIAC